MAIALTTPHWADACLRLGVPYQVAAAGLRPVVPGMKTQGPVAPVQHVGSVDVFLEACERAKPGDVMVIDNGGRTDEACIGDLTALEVKDAGLAGMLVWGLHRDTQDLAAIGLPVFSYGALPSGPRRLDALPKDALTQARFGAAKLGNADYVVADDDGAIFFANDKKNAVQAAATEIATRERAQAALVASGNNLREQLDLATYLARRASEPGFTFRQHLHERGGSIEE